MAKKKKIPKALDTESVATESVSPNIDFSDESKIPEHKESDADLKRRTKFQKRYQKMREYADLYKRKFNKNYRYYRGYFPDKYTRDSEKWRSDLNVPIIFPRVEAYQANMNDRVPDFLCKPVGDGNTDVAYKKKLALDYVLRESGSNTSFNKLKGQMLRFGLGAVGVFWDDSSKLKRDIEIGEDGKETEIVRQVPLYKEQVRVEYIDIYDFYLDPSADGIDNARDCAYRKICPAEDVRRRFWDIGLENGKYIKSGTGEVTDSRDERFNISRQVAEMRSHVSPIILPDGSRKLDIAGSNDAIDTEGMVELIYYWDHIKDSYQVWCGNICLIDAPNPYRHGELPFAICPNIEIEGEIYGLGECDILEIFQDMLNDLRNSRLDQATLSIFKTIFMTPQSGVRPDQFSVGPLKIIPVKSVREIDVLNIPPINSEAYTEEESMRRDVEQISGIADINISSEQNSSTTATGINAQERSMQARLGEKMRHFEKMFGRVLFLLSETMAQWWEEGKLIEVTGDDEVSLVKLSKEDLTSNVEISCIPGSGVAPNKLADRQQFLEFFNIVAPLDNVNTDELVKILAQKFEVPGYENLLVALKFYKEGKRAEGENDSMLRGNKAKVKEIYISDHEVHLEKHNRLVLSPDWKNMDPGIMKMILDHIDEHKSAIPTAAPVTPNASPNPNPSSELMDYQSPNVPTPANTKLVEPTVLPGEDSFGMPLL